MDYIINNGELYHYGIPGMRWGHKKGPKKKKYKNKSKLSKGKKIAIGVLAGTVGTLGVGAALLSTEKGKVALMNACFLALDKMGEFDEYK